MPKKIRYPKCQTCGHEVIGLARIDYDSSVHHAECVASPIMGPRIYNHESNDPLIKDYCISSKLDPHKGIRIVLGEGTTDYVDVCINNRGAIEIRGGDIIVVAPQVANVVEVHLQRRQEALKHEGEQDGEADE